MNEYMYHLCSVSVYNEVPVGYLVKYMLPPAGVNVG